MTKQLWSIAALLLLFTASCTGGETPPVEKSGGGGETEAPAVTNRIDIPPAVVDNLGITFVKVERRLVQKTLRVPGQFESPNESRREYFTMLPGRIEVLVNQYQTVEPGTPLFRLESPEWRRIQETLANADAEIARTASDRTVMQAERTAMIEGLKLYPARFDALDKLEQASAEHVKRLEDSRDHWQARVTELEDLMKQGVGKATELADARGELKSTLSAIAEERETQAGIEEQIANLDAEKRERQLSVAVLDARLESAGALISMKRAAFNQALSSSAGAIGMSTSELAGGDTWRTLDSFTIKANSPGVVKHVHATSGAWVEANTEIIGTVDLTKLRFRAKALQADLGLLKPGLPARVVPPEGGSLQFSAAATGTLEFPVEADAAERVLDLLVVFETPPGWARPGVTAEAEIIYESKDEPQLAIPVRCVVQDGLEKVVFVRDPDDPNKVIRKTPQLGANDGRWIEIFTGVMVGREVVLDGVYELKLTGAGKAAVDGHFHADGTFHAGSHSDEE